MRHALAAILLLPGLALAQLTQVRVCDPATGKCAAVDSSGTLKTTAGAGGGSSFGAAFPATGSAAGAKVVSTPPTYSAGNMEGPTLDTAGNLRVNVVAGGGAGGTSSSYGAAFPATGTASGFSDGTNMQAARVFDADTGVGSQYLLGAQLRLEASGGSVPVSATNPLSVVGTTYGSQGQPLKQTATNFNLQVELATGATLYDARQIRALTSGDVVTAAQGTAAASSGAWPIKIVDSAGANVGTVKAASTAAAGTDTSVVVQLNPVQPNLTTPLNANVAQVGGTTTVTGGLAGSQAIGGTAATNAAINQNPVLVGAEALSSQPAAATTGNQRRLVSTLDGALFVRNGGPVPWTCSLSALAATLTQCQAAPAAGLKLYIANIAVQTTTGTAGTFGIQAGTGTNCATGTTAIFPSSGTANRWTAPISTQPTSYIPFYVPLSNVPAANAVCVIGTATNTINIQITGFTAP